MIQSGPVFLPKGFKFSAVKAGIKASGNPDLALIIAEPKTTAAALFTRNLVTAAPIQVGRSALAKTNGRIQAVIVNSGNANCATGQPGIRDCKKVCAESARILDLEAAEVFPSSTGNPDDRFKAEARECSFTLRARRRYRSSQRRGHDSSATGDHAGLFADRCRRKATRAESRAAQGL
jgi:N-acetylglutamate synthase/N-acetylornithine aminotransferase